MPAARRSRPERRDAPGSDRWMSRQQVADMLGIHRITLWRRIRDGHFPPPQTGPDGRPGWPAAVLDDQS